MLAIVMAQVKQLVGIAMDFFEDPKNKHCWGQCSEDGECEGSARPVLVYSDGSPKMMNCGPEGMPFFYCDKAIEMDEKTGFRVEVQR